MTHHYSMHGRAARSPADGPNARLHATKRPVLNKSKGTGALCALFALASSMLVAPTEASATPFHVGPFAPGSVVVSQGGTIFGGTNTGSGVELNGDVDVYPPHANGDVAPESSFTNGSFGPTTMAFDPSGNLWVANENTSDLFELTKGQLAMPNPVPAVTIFAESGALANPFGMAFDPSGNLWVVSNAWSKVYEYTKSQLASSAAPTPAATISDFPVAPLSDAFDASGDLWVSTDTSVVEFSKADLTTTDPAPTVTISSSGGAQLVFDSSGDLWIVTGGGPYCFGTPCTNEVLEFTKGQLSTSGSPTPAVTISSTKAGPTGSIYGPYSLAFTSSGDLWVENFDGNTIVEFGKQQLSTSGSPTPVRTIVGPDTGMNSPSYVVIEP
jgi:ligand-binding sensor domain-containing protein